MYWLLTVVISSSLSQASLCKPVCNQVLYDSIYKQIIIAAIKDKNYNSKNNTIETLRVLCKGQKSSYETHK